MKFATIKLKLDMKAFFDSDFHFNWSIVIWLSWDIRNDKFLFLSNPVVISIDDNVDIVSQSNHNSIIAFELLFYTIELKIIGDIVCQSTWWLKISNDLQERRVLVFIIQIFNDTNEFNSYTEMVDSLVFVKGYLNLTFDIFSILNFSEKNGDDENYPYITYAIDWCFILISRFVLDSAILPILYLLQFDLYFTWGWKTK